MPSRDMRHSLCGLDPYLNNRCARLLQSPKAHVCARKHIPHVAGLLQKLQIIYNKIRQFIFYLNEGIIYYKIMLVDGNETGDNL